MNYEKQVTVILTVWKRNHLEEQIEAFLHQSKPPYEIWVQQTQNHVNVDDTIEKYSERVRYFYYEENKGVYGRFESVKDILTEYVYIVDDDIIPGVDFLDLALTKSVELNAVISPNGRILNPETNLTYNFIGDGYWFEHSFCTKDTLVDFGNNAWLFKAEWIKYFLNYSPLYRNNGEDIQLSASLKILGDIDTYVPKQLIPYESGNIRWHYSSDEHALHKRQDFQKERAGIVQRFRNEGWRLQKEKTVSIPQNIDPPISVVLFCEKVNDFTQQAIQSIVNQSFSDFEFIIVHNDVNGYISNILKGLNDNRIRLIDTKEPIGKYVALNIGCGSASGKYICIMSNDCVAYPERLQIQYSYMEQHQDIAASGTSCKYLLNNEIFENELTCDEALLSLIYKNNFIEESLIVRNDILREIKYFRNIAQVDMFYSFMIRLSFYGNISNIPECLNGTHSNKESLQEQQINTYFQKQLLLNFRQTRANIKTSLINKMLNKLEKRGLLS